MDLSKSAPPTSLVLPTESSLSEFQQVVFPKFDIT